MGRHIFLFFFLSLPLPVLAASLQVSPTTVTYKQDGKAEVVWLSSTGSDSVTGQVRVYEWTQHDGNDVLVPTRDVIASPSIVSIPEDKTQLVRLIRKTSPDTKEKAYRLIINELPRSAREKEQTGVQLLLKYSIPVFIPPSKQATVPVVTDSSPLQGISVSVHQTGERTWLEVDNKRSEHIRLSELEFVPKNGKSRSLHSGLLGYVLAGSHRQWDITGPLSEGEFRAIINDGTTHEKLLSYTR